MNRTKDVKEYIKLLSTVPAKFVDDFFEFYKEDALQTEFVVDLDKVALWLQSRKSDLLKTLRSTYKEKIDYIIHRDVSDLKYGNNYYKCLITPDCFKRLCMLSRTKNAELVRTYFIEIESLMIKYRTQLIAGIREDILRMQKQRKLRKSIDKNQGYVYIIKASTKREQMYKIGHAKNLIQRLRTYQTGKLEDVEVVFVYKANDYVAVERCVKALVDKSRVEKGKEIYDLNLDMLKSIMEGCGRMSMKLEHRSREKSQIGGHYYIVLARDE